MKWLAIIFLSTYVLFADEIRVAAAANLGYVFDELKKEFLKDRKNDDIVVSLGSSGKLNSQIKSGANYAIFMAANMDFANDLYKNGYSKNQPEIYARGVLVMFSADEKELNRGLEILKDENIKKISVANTKTAPYGIASKQAFQEAKIYEDIKDKLVYAGSISGVMPHVLSGAADIGFIAKSALIGKNVYKKGENFIEVNRNLYKPLDQGMILLKEYENNKLAKDFYNFLKSKKAKEIFKRYGYE
ncbi:molybdate ABC transporter substrate-binding protein [Campylobacter sp. FMV-PI01]|uniref:Molybdate ABC transporter substrate-binding protein n=1 Tax=Campylobacter portucalensis TaxID=2608384 RepID=A0A6L5WJE6_9BACT|nr:molybdate ABC transporter substrate-binding protein [Campylobacter portucalensis]MSN95963.1 molybdate ABC transporter substrate-binding protein [Campylobacter portucalensis]